MNDVLLFRVHEKKKQTEKEVSILEFIAMRINLAT